MDNLSEKLKSALPDRDVPPEFDELVKNTFDPNFSKEEPEIHKSRKAYIFLIIAIFFILIIFLKK